MYSCSGGGFCQSFGSTNGANDTGRQTQRSPTVRKSSPVSQPLRLANFPTRTPSSHQRLARRVSLCRMIPALLRARKPAARRSTRLLGCVSRSWWCSLRSRTCPSEVAGPPCCLRELRVTLPCRSPGSPGSMFAVENIYRGKMK